jgi:hypothetical protein
MAQLIDEDSSDDEQGDPTFGQDEIGGSQLFDAPHATQPEVRVTTQT